MGMGGKRRVTCHAPMALSKAKPAWFRTSDRLVCYTITGYRADMGSGFNFIYLGLGARLALAAVGCAVVWGAVLWALA